MACIQINPSLISIVVAYLAEQHVMPLEQELDKTNRGILQAKQITRIGN
jgi:hypothetical protein